MLCEATKRSNAATSAYVLIFIACHDGSCDLVAIEITVAKAGALKVQ